MARKKLIVSPVVDSNAFLWKAVERWLTKKDTCPLFQLWQEASATSNRVCWVVSKPDDAQQGGDGTSGFDGLKRVDILNVHNRASKRPKIVYQPISSPRDEPIPNMTESDETMRLSAPVNIGGLAELIQSPQCRSIAVLTGAGVSVASGIPDFRSPGGMYDTLKPELLTATPNQQEWMRRDPTAVVMWDMFKTNPFPYLEVRRPFILGTRDQKWKATIAHRFFELLHTKTNKLTRIYTQNIDGLNRQCTDLPPEITVPVHGSISQVGCEGCGADMDFDVFCELLQSNIKDIYGVDSNAPPKSTPIHCPNCNKALVKPKTVLFGRSLPEEFFVRTEEDLPNVDLLIVAGTSLVVSPANSLVYRVPESTIRVVANTEPVGQELGIQYNNDDPKSRDFFAQGACDEVFLELIQELGWMDDLLAKKDLLPPSSQALLDG